MADKNFPEAIVPGVVNRDTPEAIYEDIVRNSSAWSLENIDGKYLITPQNFEQHKHYISRLDCELFDVIAGHYFSEKLLNDMAERVQYLHTWNFVAFEDVIYAYSDEVKRVDGVVGKLSTARILNNIIHDSPVNAYPDEQKRIPNFMLFVDTIFHRKSVPKPTIQNVTKVIDPGNFREYYAITIRIKQVSESGYRYYKMLILDNSTTSEISLYEISYKFTNGARVVECETHINLSESKVYKSYSDINFEQIETEDGIQNLIVHDVCGTGSSFWKIETFADVLYWCDDYISYQESMKEYRLNKESIETIYKTLRPIDNIDELTPTDFEEIIKKQRNKASLDVFRLRHFYVDLDVFGKYYDRIGR